MIEISSSVMLSYLLMPEVDTTCDNLRGKIILHIHMTQREGERERERRINLTEITCESEKQGKIMVKV